MNWYYVDAAGQQAGPVDDEGLNVLAANGSITPETLVWKEGMPNWQSLREANPAGARTAAAPAIAGVPPVAAAGAVGGVEEAVCAECGGIFPITDTIRIGSQRVCARCKPVFVQKMREGVNVEAVPGQMRYAGFWVRFAAWFLDTIIVSAVNFGLSFAVIGTSATFGNLAAASAVPITVSILLKLVQIGIGVGYYTFMIGRFGATLGKMACKIQVVVADGSKVSYLRAMGRYFAMFLSGILCAIGYIMAGFDTEKRALHDRICNTRVIYQ